MLLVEMLTQTSPCIRTRLQRTRQLPSTYLHLDPIVPAVTFGIVTSWKTKRATTTLHLVAQLRIATLMTLEGDALCRHI